MCEAGVCTFLSCLLLLYIGRVLGNFRVHSLRESELCECTK